MRRNPFEKREPPDSWYDPDELEDGIEVEHEHTRDRRIARRIAKDHLDEDPLYYRKLASLGLNPYEETKELVMLANPGRTVQYEGIKVRYEPTPGFGSHGKQIKNPDDFLEFAARSGMLDDVRERLYAVYLNQNMRPTGYRLISAGGRASAPVDIPTIFGPAVALQASSIAVIHNHPSGNMTPSPQDLALTKAIKDAGNLLNIRVVEHLVVGGDGKALAFSEKGLL